MVKVTVIVPIYNAESTIDKTIKSILNQTLEEIQIILINDGSTDKSLEIIKEFELLDKRILVLNKKNGGVSSARNYGIKYAKGEFITFVDADDYIDIEMYERMYYKIKEDDYDLCMCNYILEENEKKIHSRNYLSKNILIKDKIMNELISMLIGAEHIASKKRMCGYRGPVMYLYKREIIDKFNIEFSNELKIGEDFLFNLQYMSNIQKIFVLNEYFYHYCRNSNSVTQKYKNNCWQIYCNLIGEVDKLFSDKYLNDILKQKINVFKLTCVISCIANEAHIDNPKSYRDKILTIREIMNEALVRNSLKNYNLYNSNLISKFYYLLLDRKCSKTIYFLYKFKNKIT